MNINEIKKNLQKFCEDNHVIMYACEDDPCTVIEELLTMEEAQAGVVPERLNFEFVTSEVFTVF